MHADAKTIRLTDAQREALAELSDRVGKPWPDILDEALSTYRSRSAPHGHQQESFSAAATRLGLVGSVEGPADLSTNPVYMEGFGTRGS